MSGKFSLAQVGMKFKRNYATVLYAVKTVKDLWDSSFDFRAKVIPILKKLNLPDNHFEKVYIKKIAPKTTS